MATPLYGNGTIVFYGGRTYQIVGVNVGDTVAFGPTYTLKDAANNRLFGIAETKIINTPAMSLVNVPNSPFDQFACTDVAGIVKA